jgi:hypothetical protein
MHARVTREDLRGLACAGDEVIIARHFPEAGLEHLARFLTREERQFAFRCFWVPFEMVAACEQAFNSPQGRAWSVWQFALLLAHSRMLREMAAWRNDPRQSWWEPQSAANACGWWMECYDEYQHAIDAAYQYWLKRRCLDSRHDQPKLAAAASFGFVQREDVGGLPAGVVGRLLAEFKKREQTGSREAALFHKNANPQGASDPRWDYPDIDIWLIEVWPLISQYNWTYKEAYELLLAKFGDDDAYSDASVLGRVGALKERCELLGLRLSPLAQERTGRPPKTGDDEPLLATFGERTYRQALKIGLPLYQNFRAHAAESLQALAEMAVSIEPLTRLLAGTTKEPIDFAYPRLEMGGKNTSAAPPFCYRRTR